MEGIDFKIVKDLAGHKTITMTDRYAVLTPEHFRKAAERAVLPVPTGTKTDTSHMEEQRVSPENGRKSFEMLVLEGGVEPPCRVTGGRF